MSASNVPMGAEYDSSAPWNQVENPEIERDCEETETITRKVTLSTTDYIAEDDWNDDIEKERNLQYQIHQADFEMENRFEIGQERTFEERYFGCI